MLKVILLYGLTSLFPLEIDLWGILGKEKDKSFRKPTLTLRPSITLQIQQTLNLKSYLAPGPTSQLDWNP